MSKIIATKTNIECAGKERPISRKAARLEYRVLVNVLASVFIMCCAGSVYAWSIFVEPLKATVGLSTAQTQLIFGLIIASFSITMLFVGRIERRLGPRLPAAIGPSR